ncbi:MAG: transposase [Bdellovibrionales bacterium]|nr:transposase [Bdellovibrionales bacterium]
METNRIKRKYYTRERKIKILRELETGGMTHTELARKYGIHPITLYSWKRLMGQENNSKPDSDYEEVLNENSQLKKEVENLKKALGELAVDKQILQTANDILKKSQRKTKLKSQKKSSKK